MHRLLTRIVAMSLVLCVMADPAVAFTLNNSLFPGRIGVRRSIFFEQALAAPEVAALTPEPLDPVASIRTLKTEAREFRQVLGDAPAANEHVNARGSFTIGPAPEYFSVPAPSAPDWEMVERVGIAIRRFRHSAKIFNLPKHMASAMRASELLMQSSMKNGRSLPTIFSDEFSQTYRLLRSFINDSPLWADASKHGVLSEELAERIKVSLIAVRRRWNEFQEGLDSYIQLSANIKTLPENEQQLIARMVHSVRAISEELQSTVYSIYGRRSSTSHPTDTILSTELLADWFTTAHIEFESNLPSDAMVLGDRLLIQNALYNLIKNSLYYAGRRQIGESVAPAVKVGLALHEGIIQIQMEDNGPGVAEHILRGFPGLLRLNDSRRPGGTGQGLADASYSILDAGGIISVDSLNEADVEQALYRPPKGPRTEVGTTFTIRLPMADVAFNKTQIFGPLAVRDQIDRFGLSKGLAHPVTQQAAALIRRFAPLIRESLTRIARTYDELLAHPEYEASVVRSKLQALLPESHFSLKIKRILAEENYKSNYRRDFAAIDHLFSSHITRMQRLIDVLDQGNRLDRLALESPRIEAEKILSLLDAIKAMPPAAPAHSLTLSAA
jgi:signal transduction histidine kinase